MRRLRRVAALATLAAALAAALATALATALASCAYYRADTENRILAVGIDAYAYINELSACVSDARDIAAAVSADTRVRILGDADSETVTKDRVLSAIAAAAAEAPSGGYGVFMFHYSGHGDPALGGILIMGDATAAFAADTVITVDELLAEVSAVPAKVRVVILDSCYSGLFVDSGSSVSTLPGDGGKNFVDLVAEAADRYDEAADGDLIVMSAAGGAELSQEFATQDLAHGYFTMGLLESAKYGDANRDGLVTLTEAFDYASRYVEATVNEWYPSYAYYPRLSGSALDVVLFAAK